MKRLSIGACLFLLSLIGFAQTTLTITGSFTINNRQYTGTTPASILTNSLLLVGVIGGDDVTLNVVANFDDKNVGTGKTVNLNSSFLSGAQAGNYILSFATAPTATGNIDKMPLTVTAIGPLKTYGQALVAGPSSTNFTAAGTVAGETVNTVILIPNAAGLSATTAAGLAYTVTPSLATGTGGFSTSNYNISYGNYNGNVDLAPLTITANNASKNYGTTLTGGPGSTSFTSAGLQNGETIISVTITYAAGGAQASAPVGVYPGQITASAPIGAGGFIVTNYAITYMPGDVLVTPLPLTVTATGPAKTYGTALTAGTSTTNFTATGTIAGETVTSVTLTPNAAGLSATTAAGAAYVVTPSLATGTGGFLESNYLVTYNAYNGTVSKKALTITATGPAKIYGTALTTGTSTTNFTHYGEITGETVTSVTLTPDAAGASATTAAGLAYAVIPSLATGTGGFLESNYLVTYNGYSGTVSKKALTITATGPTKIYGTALTAGTSATNFTHSGEIAGETVTSVTLTPNAAGLSATTAAGGAYVVTPSLATGTGGFLESNYLVTYNAYNGTVSKKALTVTATGPTKTYGTALTPGTSATNFTHSGEIAGETVTSVTLTPDAAGASTTTAAGAAYVVTPSLATGTGGFLESNYLVTYNAYNGTVSKKALTVTATGPAKIYGTALTTGTSATNFTSSGEITGELVTSVTLTPNAAGLSATTAAGAAYVVTPSLATGTGGFLESNYLVTYNAYNGTVSKKALTITATGPAKIYGTALTTGTSTTNFTHGGEITGETVTSVTLTPDAAGTSATTAAGLAYTVIPSLATGTGGFLESNYLVTYNGYSGTVSKKALTITATGPTKTYGTKLLPGTSATNFTHSGEIAGETVTSVTLTPDAAGASATTAAGAAYVVTPSLATGTGGFLESNYLVTYNAYNGTVSKKALTITATGPAKIYGTALTTGTSATNFTSSGEITGELVTSVTLTPNAAGLSATTAAGAAYVVTPSLATGTGGFLESNYLVTYNAYNGTVSKKALTITATGPAKPYGTVLTTGASTTDFTATGTITGETVASVILTPDAAGASATTAAGLAYTVIPSLATGTGGFLESNYLVTYNGYSGMVSKKALTVTANNVNKTYGQLLTGAVGSTAFTSSGLQNSETIGTVTIAYGTGAAATAAVGTFSGSVTPSAATGGTFLASNYSISYTAGNIVVGPAALTITAWDVPKTYGVTLPGVVPGVSTFTTSGLQNGETIGTVTYNYGTGAAGNAAVGTYNGSVTPSAPTGGSFATGNYTITYIAANIIVNAAALTVTATGPAKPYGTVLTAGTSTTNFTVTGLQNSETVTSVTLTPNAAGISSTTAAGGAYVVTPSLAIGAGGFLTSNYTITYTAYNGTVTRRALTVTANNANKTYGTTLTGAAGSTAFTSSGLQNGETIGTVTIAYSGTGNLLNGAVGTYASSVTPSAATGGTYLASNYSTFYATGSIIVDAAPLTVTATGPAKTYGTALTAGTSTTNFIATGAISGETVTGVTLTPNAAGLSATTAALAPYVVTPSLATGIGGFLATNYTITYADYNGTVSKKALTVTATGPIKEYGTVLTIGPSTTNFTHSGEITGEDITSVTLTPNAAGISATTPVGAAYVVTPSLATGTGGFLESNYTVTYVAYNGIVIKKQLTVTATGPTKTYGTSLTTGTSATNFTATGMYPGETVTSVTLTPDAAGLSATTPAQSAYVVTPSAPTGAGGFLASNYDITFVSYNGLVDKLPITITPSAGQKKVYGAADPTPFTYASVPALIGTDVFSGLVSRTAGESVGSYSFNIGTLSAGPNYTVTFATSPNFSITAKPMTITATGPTKIYGTILTTGTSTANFTASGAITGETVTGVTLTPNAAGTSATTAAGAAYMVTPSLATGTGGYLTSNYTITYVAYNGTVTVRPLSITANVANKTYGATLTGGAGSTAFTSSGLQNSETIGTVTIAYGTGAAPTAAVNTYAGSVTASLATGGTFTASNYSISYTAGNIVVGPAALTITANNVNKTYGATLTGGTGSTAFTSTGLKNGETIGSVTIAYGSGSSAADPVATYSGSVSISAATGGTFAATNYTISYSAGNIVIGPKAMTVTATGPTKMYGATITTGTSTTNFTASGAITGETVTGVTLTPDAAGALPTTATGAAYMVTPSLATGTGGYLTSNYTITYVAYNGTVTVRPLSITANVANKTYGVTLTGGAGSTAFTSSGLQNSETISTVTIAYGTGAAPTAAVNTYAGTVTPSLATGGTFTASNYSISYTAGNIVVDPAALTIIANNVNKTYGTALTGSSGSTAFTPTGLKNGETIGSVTIAYGSGYSPTAAVGTYTGSVTVSAATGGTFSTANYTISYTAGSIIIAPKSMTITATGPTRIYGSPIFAGTSTTNFTASGTITGETVTSVTLTPNPAGSSYTTPAGGTYTVTPSAPTGTGGFLITNYNISPVGYNGVVSKAPLTVNANNKTKTYGTTLTNGSGSVDFNTTGIQNGETIGSVTVAYGTGASPTVAVGTYLGQVTVSAATGGTFSINNYNVTYTSGNIIVNPAALTITAHNINKFRGTILTGGTGSTAFSATGLQNGENITSVTISYGSGAAAADSSLTTYPNSVTPSAPIGSGGFLATNYTITPTSGSINVYPKIHIATQPANKSDCEYRNITFSVGLNTGVLSPKYTWQYRETSAAAWKNLTPAAVTHHNDSTKDLSVDNIQKAYNGYQFRCWVVTKFYENDLAVTKVLRGDSATTSTVTLSITKSPPLAPVLKKGSNILICTNADSVTYLWSWSNSGTPPGTVNKQYYISPNTITDASIYSVTTTNKTTTCSTKVTYAQSGTDPVIPITNVPGIVIAPNPNNGNFTVTISGLTTNVATKVFVRDYYGSTFLASTKTPTSGTLTIQSSEINSGKVLKPGIYFIDIIQSNKRAIAKIIVNSN